MNEYSGHKIQIVTSDGHRLIAFYDDNFCWDIYAVHSKNRLIYLNTFFCKKKPTLNELRLAHDKSGFKCADHPIPAGYVV